MIRKINLDEFQKLEDATSGTYGDWEAVIRLFCYVTDYTKDIIEELKASRKVVEAARNALIYIDSDMTKIYEKLENALAELDGEK